MLSLFNGMHRTDIMSEIVSGRQPFLSAPGVPAETPQHTDSCPRSSDSSAFLPDLRGPACGSRAALQQVQTSSSVFGGGGGILRPLNFSGVERKRPRRAEWPV